MPCVQKTHGRRRNAETVKKMKFNAEKFFKDHGIDYAKSGNKHCRPGWINVHCPFCAGSQDYHLGVNPHHGYGHCWRCGWKGLDSIAQALLNCPWWQAKNILTQYSAKTGATRVFHTAGQARTGAPEKATIPQGTGPMDERHKEYLRKRNYDPDELEELWGLLGTGPVAFIQTGGKKINYNHRIIIPINIDGRMVSFQGRDISGKAGDLKYLASPEALEVIPHKEVVYGADLVPGSSVIVVEGVPDVWRLGPGAVGTFGTAFKAPQVKLLVERFDRFFILFDTEHEAQNKARDLATRIASVGKEVEILKLEEGDPGEMKQDDADALMAELGIKRRK